MGPLNIFTRVWLKQFFVLLGDAQSHTGPSAAAPLAAPVGVPPGLEYLTQVGMLFLIIILLSFHGFYLITKHG